jgi:hypothetical protein
MALSNKEVRRTIENVFKQPADYVIENVNRFMSDIKKGPGLRNTELERQTLLNRYFQGGLAMGFTDWESEIAAAALAGYTPMDICLSFRNNRGWKDTTVEKIQSLTDIIAPRFIEKGRATGLIPKETEEESGIPKLDVTTVGGVTPWEHTEYQSNATDVSK